MWTPEFLVVATAVFLLAGFIKGVIGIGLPTISIALLAATFDLKAGLALIVIPAFVTNVWQAVAGGAFKRIARRLAVFIVTAAVGVWFGVGVLSGADAAVISGLFGIMLCVYCTIALATPQIPPPGRFEPWLAPAIGGISGFIAGLMGSFVVPGSLYLQALGQPRDIFVQTMGIVFTCITVALGVSLLGHGMMPKELGILSFAALVPALLGMAAGQRIRKHIPEARFRQIFFFGMLALGLYMALRAFAV
ncbi:MAG TPA: sulfite exporter TauE/SafE family protein [Alphaproteobacteria bacterium]|nr:sulfite exporter TauE/SafE family protein [Alphaproteobacteria bacterium]